MVSPLFPEGQSLRRVARPTEAQWRPFIDAPCLLEGLLEGVAADLTLAGLRARHGRRPVPVEFSARAIYRPDPRVDGGRYARSEMPLADAIDALTDPAPGAPHRYLSTVDLEAVLPDLHAEAGAPTRFHPTPCFAVFLFAGGAGSGSQTHYDLTDNFVAVFEGRKRVWLLPPGGLGALRPWPAVFRPCHFSRLREGMPAGVTPLECAVGPGEVLYIPAHWWHYIENERATSGVTYSHEPHASRDRLRWRHLRVAASLRAHHALERVPRLGALADRALGAIARRALGLSPPR